MRVAQYTPESTATALAPAATHRCVGRRPAVIGCKNDNLIDIEDGACASHLADQVTAQLVRLRIIDDRAWESDCDRPRAATCSSRC